MSQKSFSLAAGVLFLLVALGHLLRIVFRLSLVVQGVSIAMWVSVIALAITSFLAYNGLRLTRKSLSIVWARFGAYAKLGTS